jgi:pyruvate/2-oxoglutarate dehydrogenase complex dihydrolipoamide acyltransferase (E2) component
MDVDFIFTGFGEMPDGQVTKWLKGPGERVAVGEVVLQVETAKADVDIEAPVDGVLGAIQAAEGSVIEAGTVLAVIVTD